MNHHQLPDVFEHQQGCAKRDILGHGKKTGDPPKEVNVSNAPHTRQEPLPRARVSSIGAAAEGSRPLKEGVFQPLTASRSWLRPEPWSSSPDSCPSGPSQIRARRFPPLGSSVEESYGALAQI